MLVSNTSIPYRHRRSIIAPIFPMSLLIASQLSLGCQQGQIVGLKYSYQGSCGQDTAQLLVTVRSGDRVSPAISLKPIAADGQSVALRLPANVPSPASVLVEAKNSQECTIGRGQIDNIDFTKKRDASNPADDIPVELVCLSTPECASPDGGAPALDPAVRPSYLWGMRCASDGDDIATGAAFDGAGNVYISGSFSTPAGGIKCQFDNAANQNLFETSLPNGGSFVAKLAADGKIGWVRSLGTLAGSTFDVYETRITASDSGAVYVSGYAENLASIDNGMSGRESLAAQRFIAKYDTSGQLGWVYRASLSSGSPQILRTTSLKAVTIAGKTHVLLGGICQNALFGAGGSCVNRSQFVLRIEDLGQSEKVSPVSLFELTPTSAGDPNLGVFDIGSDKEGRIMWTGGNTTTVNNTGIAGISNATTYLVRSTVSLVWDGGVIIDNKQAINLTLVDNDKPWMQDIIRYGVHSYIDKDGNTYVGSLLAGPPNSMAWLNKYSATGSSAVWTSNVSPAIDNFAFLGITGDNQQNPTWAAHIRMYNLNESVNFSDAYSSVIGPTTTSDRDIIIGKYDKDFTKSANGTSFYWQTPIRIALGSTSPVGFDVHPGSNRIAIFSRTKQAAIKLDSVLLDKLNGPVASKMMKYDLILLMLGPK